MRTRRSLLLLLDDENNGDSECEVLVLCRRQHEKNWKAVYLLNAEGEVERGIDVSGARRMNTMSNACAAVLKLLVSPGKPRHEVPLARKDTRIAAVEKLFSAVLLSPA